MSTCNLLAHRSKAWRAVIAIAVFGTARASSAQPPPAAQQPLEQRPQPTPPQPPPTPPQVAAPPLAIACDECARGDEELAALGSDGAMLRAFGDEIVARWVPLRIEEAAPTSEQEAAIRGHLRDRQALHLAIRRLRDKTELQLLAIGHALCHSHSPDADCARYLAGGLRVARAIDPNELAAASLPPVGLPQTCDPYLVRVRSPNGGLGFEYASGWQASARPVDGRVWSLGVEARARLGGRYGMVARIDRSTGRDEARDADGDGRDDLHTGDVTRWTALVGPTLWLAVHRDRRLPRYWQLDGLVGVSRSGDQSGPIAAADLSYRFAVVRLGVRALQGFGEAGAERAALVHAGFSFGAGPQYSYGAGCDFVETHPRGSAWAIALDLPVSGWAHDAGYITPGFGLEGALHVHPRFDALVRADLLAMPSGERERALHSSVLAGGRVDFSGDHGRTRTGVFATLAAGYAHVATASSAEVHAGPVVDTSVGWGGQGPDGAAYVRLHLRAGVGPDNTALRAVFLSLGAELRLDRDRWRDRL